MGFKYISCSYLSVYDKCAFVVHHNLNTSHVLIYRSSLEQKGMALQNLNTSHVLIYLFMAGPLRLENIFKYISCSYLSIKFPSMQEHHSNLNTSHVLIYREDEVVNGDVILDLNTSHVLIYRNYVKNAKRKIRI